MVDFDSFLLDLDEYFVLNTKYKFFYFLCRKIVLGNEKKFIRRDDFLRYYKENVLNEKYWFIDEEEYNLRRYGFRIFYVIISDESNLSEDDYRFWKLFIRYLLFLNWEDEENVYEYDDFRKSEKKRRYIEYIFFRKLK